MQQPGGHFRQLGQIPPPLAIQRGEVAADNGQFIRAKRERGKKRSDYALAAPATEKTEGDFLSVPIVPAPSKWSLAQECSSSWMEGSFLI